MGDDLVETFSRILIESRSADIEDYLLNKGIHRLPDDELALLTDGNPPSQDDKIDRLENAESMTELNVEEDANKSITNDAAGRHPAHSPTGNVPVAPSAGEEEKFSGRSASVSNHANIDHAPELPEETVMIGNEPLSGGVRNTAFRKHAGQEIEESERHDGADTFQSQPGQDGIADDDLAEVQISSSSRSAIHDDHIGPSDRNRQSSATSRRTARASDQHKCDFGQSRTAPSRTDAADERDEEAESQDEGRIPMHWRCPMKN